MHEQPAHRPHQVAGRLAALAEYRKIEAAGEHSLGALDDQRAVVGDRVDVSDQRFDHRQIERIRLSIVEGGDRHPCCR